MSKYQKYCQQMFDLNKDAFAKFKTVHDKYASDPKSFQQEFNEVGRDIQDIIREWEDKLCSHSENSGYGKFSTTLSDKFWEEIRKVFPKVDHIGLLA